MNAYVSLLLVFILYGINHIVNRWNVFKTYFGGIHEKQYSVHSKKSE